VCAEGEKFNRDLVPPPPGVGFANQVMLSFELHPEVLVVHLIAVLCGNR
jgi:hypothetical protein